MTTGTCEVPEKLDDLLEYHMAKDNDVKSNNAEEESENIAVCTNRKRKTRKATNEPIKVLKVKAPKKATSKPIEVEKRQSPETPKRNSKKPSCQSHKKRKAPKPGNKSSTKTISDHMEDQHKEIQRKQVLYHTGTGLPDATDELFKSLLTEEVLEEVPSDFHFLIPFPFPGHEISAM